MLLRPILHCVSITTACLVLCACGSKNANPPPEETKTTPPVVIDVTAENGAALISNAVCDREARCLPWSGASHDDCLASLRVGSGNSNLDSIDAVFASVKAGRAQLVADKARQCLSDIQQLACGASFPRLSSLVSCQQAFVGLTGSDEICIANEACVPGTTCRQDESTDASSCMARCQPLTKNTCRRNADCSDSRVCDGETCVAATTPGGVSERCSAGQPCQAGLVCRASDDTIGQAVCVKLAAAGEACAVGDSQSCADPTLVCTPKSNFEAATCTSAKKRGEACSLAFECGGVGSPLICSNGTCVERPTTGACIRVGTMGVCDFNRSFCDESSATPTCVTYRSAGEPCASSAECASNGGGSACVPDTYGVKRCAAATAPALCHL